MLNISRFFLITFRVSGAPESACANKFASEFDYQI